MKKVLFFMFVAILGLMKVSYGDGLTDSHTVGFTIPAFSLIDIEPAASKALSLTLTTPTEAGTTFADVTNNTLWLNYTAIKSISTQYKVSVNMSPVIAGFDLKVVAGAASGAYGTAGTPQSLVTLTGTDQVLINAIGSCYTGDGANKGHNLTYTLSPSTTNFGNMVGGGTATSTTITYTIASY
jgi:hypothetical protein